jgi:hypothetical protein
MAVTEEARYEVHKYFEGTMGPQRAATLMEMLPPVGWGDIATKQYVGTQIDLVRKDLDNLREGLRKDIDNVREGLRNDIDNVREGLRKELDSVHGGLRKDIDNLREVMATKADVADRFRKQLLAIWSTNLGLAGLILGAVKLL